MIQHLSHALVALAVIFWFRVAVPALVLVPATS